MWNKIKQYITITFGIIMAVIAAVLGIKWKQEQSKNEQNLKKIEEMKREIAAKEIEIKNKEYDLYQEKLKNEHSQKIEELQKEVDIKKENLIIDKQKLDEYIKDVIGTSTSPGTIILQ